MWCLTRHRKGCSREKRYQVQRNQFSRGKHKVKKVSSWSWELVTTHSWWPQICCHSAAASQSLTSLAQKTLQSPLRSFLATSQQSSLLFGAQSFQAGFAQAPVRKMLSKKVEGGFVGSVHHCLCLFISLHTTVSLQQLWAFLHGELQAWFLFISFLIQLSSLPSEIQPKETWCWIFSPLP